MTFQFREARRVNVPLLLGLAGGTGSGKSMSALELAKGLSGGKKFAFIDTEAGRGLHYADMYDFDHGDLMPPFTPQAYADAIKAADDAGYGVIVVDSASHEHAGEGGLLDWHNAELDRMAGDDWKKREAMTFSAWVKPKQAHQQMVNRLLQVRAHVILCFRAAEKIEIVKEQDASGRMKTVVRPKRSLTGADGWIPISEKNLPFELTASFLLTADAPGVPKPIKLNAQHRPFFPLDSPITSETGVRLAAWASGGSAPADPTSRTDTTSPLEDAQRQGAEKLATEPQRRLIFARAKEADVDEAGLRAIIDAHTGQTSTAAIPAEKVEAILGAIGVPAESPFKAPEGVSA